MNFFCEMADIQNYLLIEYKDEYQKSKWTIECRIFISFIWSRSELWNRKNNNVFTKKTKIGMTRFRRLYDYFFCKKISPYTPLLEAYTIINSYKELWFRMNIFYLEPHHKKQAYNQRINRILTNWFKTDTMCYIHPMYTIISIYLPCTII